jgi:clan AA aspartic protease
VHQLNGRVDESLRALLDVAIRRTESEVPTIVTVWIDTAFNGFLVFPQELIEKLGLQQEAATEAILADGNRVTLESYVCYVDWFGEVRRAQVIGNSGKIPLLGTELLAKRKLLIDYVTCVVSVS